MTESQALLSALMERRISRSALSVVYFLSNVEDGATYAGIQYGLGLGSLAGAMAAVSKARSMGLVSVTSYGPGRGNKAVVKLSERGRLLHQIIFRR